MVIRDIRLQRHARRLIEGGSLPLQPGKVTVLFGASGCGKSTLLYALADLDPDVRLATADGADPLARERIGLVPQQCAVFEDLGTAGRNLAFAHAHGHGHDQPPSAGGDADGGGGEPTNRRTAVGGSSAGDPANWPSHDPAAGSLEAALDAARRDLGVDPDWCMPLSGGQKQRVAIARALVGGATVLLCDEPTSGLDPSSRREAIRCIRRAAAAGVAVLVVTHDLEWNHPDAADHAVLLRQSRLQALQPGAVMQPDWFGISTVAPAASAAGGQDQQGAGRPGALWDFVRTLGAGCWWFGLLPVQVLRGLAGPDRVRARWLGVFLRHFGRMTMGGSSLVYLAVAGLLVGFSSLYFTVGALDPSPHLQTLMVPELLSGSGFGLYRVIVPLIAALLVSAKCGSALAADIGNRQYGGQIGVMRTMGANPESYLLLAAVTAFAVGMPLLSLLAFGLAAVGSLAGYLMMFPGETIYAWRVEFFRLIQPGEGSWLWQGTMWNAAKLACSGAGVAVIGYYCGVLPKSGNTDVGRDIARATLWGSLWCLLVFTLFALVEF